ncbi:hypothetical protein SAMN04488029_0129 [Reichenbachiella faecimaris]|uniref:Uncharacterized protein n=1 Tax=Reichenbachiella faecimaris TaxID=692418 RepID=A0A1W2G5S3_REIFA|nr:hypothetical protein [Reichenbachiella faecimaris]SMD31792.1 hypothetical protein SAMN04488029_0129 [Reichenbachiella faecimaris]
MEKLLEKIAEIRVKAASSSKSNSKKNHLRSDDSNALDKAIKTKDDADLFMKRLRAL